MMTAHSVVVPKRHTVRPEGARPTAVIVDDSNVARFFARNVLVQLGCTVVAEGASGFDASRLYEAHRPQLLLLDLVLPQRDGLAAAEAIMARFPTANVVLCSAFASREQVLQARSVGVSGFLLKPVSRDRLMTIVGSLIHDPGVK
jgi:two-component system chemotaxis response regulator CheY